MTENGLRRRRSSQEDAVDENERREDEHNEHVIIDVRPSIQVRISNQITAISRSSSLQKLLRGVLAVIGIYGCYYFIYHRGRDVDHGHRKKLQSYASLIAEGYEFGDQHLRFIRQLGYGHDGTVYKLYSDDASGRSYYALKVYSKSSVCENEAAILRSMQEDQINKVPKLKKANCDAEEPRILMSFVPGQSLDWSINYAELREQIIPILEQMAEGRGSKKIKGHFDVNVANILQDDDEYSLIDFGRSVMLDFDDLENNALFRGNDLIIGAWMDMSPETFYLNRVMLERYKGNVKNIREDKEELQEMFVRANIYSLNAMSLSLKMHPEDYKMVKDLEHEVKEKWSDVVGKTDLSVQMDAIEIPLIEMWTKLKEIAAKYEKYPDLRESFEHIKVASTLESIKEHIQVVRIWQSRKESFDSACVVAFILLCVILFFKGFL